MIQPGRGRILTLAAMLVMLVLFALVGAYVVYWYALPEEGVNSARNIPDEEPAENRIEDGYSEKNDLLTGVQRLRAALLSKLPEGETSRFTLVFNRLETAAVENRIDHERFRQLPTILRNALDDGKIVDDELGTILDFLELSIIPHE
ncbi:hypothetical protein DRQ36_05505 [bacterium]|nr:MAG: hypothetical protein DRQ36_05505 [bacterium]